MFYSSRRLCFGLVGFMRFECEFGCEHSSNQEKIVICCREQTQLIGSLGVGLKHVSCKVSLYVSYIFPCQYVSGAVVQNHSNMWYTVKRRAWRLLHYCQRIDVAFTIFPNSVFLSWKAKGEADALTDKLPYKTEIRKQHFIFMP